MKLKNFIKNNKLSIKKAAEELAVSYETVRKWCSGESIPRRYHMGRIQRWSNESVRVVDFYPTNKMEDSE